MGVPVGSSVEEGAGVGVSVGSPGEAGADGAHPASSDIESTIAQAAIPRDINFFI